jgi:hypothetical protein
MKFRFTVFIVFQVFAWTTYFNWEPGTPDQDTDRKAEKIVEILEMSSSQFASYGSENELFRIILRNDGFYTKINNNKSVENGLWIVDYNIPSLVLKMPTGNQKYKILEDSPGRLQVELINAQKLIQVNKEDEKEPKLFSSVN